MQYPDFVVSKTIPTQHQADRFKYIIAVLEIKNDHDDIANIKKSYATVSNALEQLGEYSARLAAMPHAKLSADGVLPSYLLYGSMYTQFRQFVDGGWEVLEGEPWQYVFQQLGPGAVTAPFTYRMCELAVRHWDL